MKAKVFIGSSSEALDFANAIHVALAHEAECTVWNTSFLLGGSTLSSLLNTVRSVDFGIFVFAPDDAADIRGNRYLIARDNVLYELGLFTGHLEPQRCFFVLPNNMQVRLPSDLEGVTHGVYETGRSDRNFTAAVGPFCAQVANRIRELSVASASLPVELHELAAKFECTDWIPEMNGKVQMKRAILRDMIETLKRRPVDKRRFLAHDRTGFKVGLAAAIQAAPAKGDVDLILATSAAMISRGVAQLAMVDAIDRLAVQGLVLSEHRARLATWLGQLLDVDPSLCDRITQLRTQFS